MLEQKKYYVYIMASGRNGTLYVGVTNDLVRRVYEHKQKLVEGFTKKYNVDNLVYYEIGEDAIEAISREKQLKDGTRLNKIRLIEGMNAEWQDLYEDL
jgi:putative endonuclease